MGEKFPDMESPADSAPVPMPAVPLVGTCSGRLIIAIVIYIAWMGETLLLGKGVFRQSLTGPADWMFPVIIVGIFIGCFVTMFFLKTSMARGMVTPAQAGLNPGKKTIPALIITGIFGGILLFLAPLAGIPLADPLGLLFFLLPLAAGEVMVCWALLATHIESALILRGIGGVAVIGLLVAAIASTLPYLAGALPIGGSIILAAVFLAGILTGFIFLVFRDIYATLLARVILMMALVGMTGISPVWEGISLLYTIPLSLVALAFLFFGGLFFSYRFRNTG